MIDEKIKQYIIRNYANKGRSKLSKELGLTKAQVERIAYDAGCRVADVKDRITLADFSRLIRVDHREIKYWMNKKKMGKQHGGQGIWTLSYEEADEFLRHRKTIDRAESLREKEGWYTTHEAAKLWGIGYSTLMLIISGKFKDKPQSRFNELIGNINKVRGKQGRIYLDKKQVEEIKKKFDKQTNLFLKGKPAKSLRADGVPRSRLYNKLKPNKKHELIFVKGAWRLVFLEE